MALRVVVWGTGNVGRPAIRAVLSHSGLELAGVVVASPDKVGMDAGDIAGVDKTGVLATDDATGLLAQGVDAVVYTATADIRPVEAAADLVACLEAGCQRGIDFLLQFSAPWLATRGSARASSGSL